MFSLFAVWHWLLCSWHLSPFPVSLATLFPVFLSFYTSPILHGHWTLHGPLCVCVHVCACIYVYREIYLWGPEGVQRSSGLAARTLRTRTCHLPFCIGEMRGCGWVPLLSSLLVALLDIRTDMGSDSHLSYLPFSTVMST